MRAFFSLCFMYWQLSFMISEHTLPGFCQLACIWRTARYAVGLISRVLFVWLALRGVYHKVSWSIRDLCCLNLHVLLLLEVHASITCWCPRWVGPWRHHFHYTILPTCDNEVTCFLRLTLGVNFFDLGACIFCTHFRDASWIPGKDLF